MSQSLINDGFTLCQHMQGFSEHIGPFFEKDIGTDGKTCRALLIQQKHLNPEGVVHGGVSLAFADYVIYRAIGDEIGHQIQFATINLNSNFVAAAKLGDILIGKGQIIRRTKSVIFAEGQLFSHDRIIMSASGVWKIIGA